MNTKNLTCTVTKKAYIDKITKGVKTFNLIEIHLSNGLKIAVQPRELIARQLIDLECTDLEVE